MSLPIRPVCKKAHTRRDGTSIIFLQYCFSQEKRTLLDSGVAIPPAYWSEKRLKINNSLPEDFGSAEALNKKLQRALRIAQDIITYAIRKEIEDPIAFVKKNFRPDLEDTDVNAIIKEQPKEVVNLDLYHQIDDYIESKKKRVSPKMANIYRNMRDTLKQFEEFRKKPITFDSFDFSFYEEFLDYMSFEHVHRRRKTIIKGFKVSSIGKTIKQLRVFLRNRMRRKIIPQINLEDFKIVDEETDAIYLTYQEILQIYNTDLSLYPHLIRHPNLFVLGCLTGLRFSDFSAIHPEDVRNGMLYKKQGKSDHWVVIPLRKEADEILQYFKQNIPSVTNSEFNRVIKKIGRHAGLNATIKFSHKKGNKDIVTAKQKYEWITSHTCRRSFCTNEFLAGTPVELIMKISGHKSLRDFYRYIRITPEEAGMKIKELWTKRGEIAQANIL